jgi:hypothetical protein
MSRMDNQNVPFSTQTLQPKPGARHYETLVIIKFIHTADKFEFESNFSTCTKSNPGCTISTSRPTPQRTPADRDMPNINDIRTRIGMLYNSKVTTTNITHPNILFPSLSTDQINSIQLGPKTKNRLLKNYPEISWPILQAFQIFS